MYIQISYPEMKADSDYNRQLSKDLDLIYFRLRTWLVAVGSFYGCMVKVEGNTKRSCVVSFTSKYMTMAVLDNYVEFFFKTLRTILPTSSTSDIRFMASKRAKYFTFSVFTISLIF